MTVGLETYAIDEWINSTLVNDTTLTNLLADANQGVHSELIPDGAKLPAVVFWPLVPGNDVRVVGPQRVGTWSQMIVAADGTPETYAALKNIAQRIDALLHGPPPTTVADGIVHASVRIMPWRRTELVGGEQRRQLGGVYKILSQG